MRIHTTVPGGPVAARIELLIRSGWTARALGQAIGTSGSALGDIRRGQPTVGTFIADAVAQVEPLPDLLRHLNKLHRSGLRWQEIAAEVGISTQALLYIRRGGGAMFKTRMALLALEPLTARTVMLEFEPLRRHLQYRMAARGLSVKSLGEAERRAWYRAVESNRITEAHADSLAIRFGLLLEEVYGPDYDEQEAA